MTLCLSAYCCCDTIGKIYLFHCFKGFNWLASLLWSLEGGRTSGWTHVAEELLTSWQPGHTKRWIDRVPICFQDPYFCHSVPLLKDVPSSPQFHRVWTNSDIQTLGGPSRFKLKQTQLTHIFPTTFKYGSLLWLRKSQLVWWYMSVVLALKRLRWDGRITSLNPIWDSQRDPVSNTKGLGR